MLAGGGEPFLLELEPWGRLLGGGSGRHHAPIAWQWGAQDAAATVGQLLRAGSEPRQLTDQKVVFAG